jgi:hypothetical protein
VHDASKEIRYDSRSRPLFRFFKLLSIAVDSLEELSASGEADEAANADELILQWGGDEGWYNINGAAMAADMMVTVWAAIKTEDAAAADFSISGPTAAQLLADMRAMFRDGGGLLQEADGTLLHASLNATKGRFVHLRRGSGKEHAVAMRWPEATPAALARLRALGVQLRP